MNHTTGPWEITSSHGPTACSSITGPKDAQGYQDLVAEIIKTGFPRRKDEGFGNPHWLQDNNLAKKTTLANARLIAAAPDMLKALNYTLSLLEEDWNVEPILEQDIARRVRVIRAVIAKATGGQS